MRGIRAVPVLAVLAAAPACKDEGEPAAETDTEAGESSGAASTSSSTGEPMADSSTGPESLCGNGTMDIGETCDDGNDVNGDGCNRDCTPSQEILYTEIWDGRLADCAEGVAIDSEGNVIAVGYVEIDAGQFDIWIRKHDATLTESWLVLENGPAGGEDRARAVDVAPDDTIVVAGFVEGDGIEGRNVWVQKYDATGEAVWAAPHTYTGEYELGDDSAYGVTVLSDGSTVVVGETLVAEQDADAWIRKLDPDGNEVWTVTHAGEADAIDSARGVAAGPGDEIHVTGWETAADGGRRIWTARLTSSGEEDWSATYTAGSLNGNVGHGIGVRSDLSAVATGSQREGSEDTDLWIGAYDADGAEILNIPVAGESGGADIGRGVGIGSDDTAAIVGTLYGFGGGPAFYIGKYDASGAEQWTQTLGGDTKPEAEARAVAVDPRNDHLVVAGCQATQGDITSVDVMLVKITP